MNNNSLLLSQSHSLQTDTCLTQNNSIASTMDNLPEPDQTLVAMDQLVEVGDAEDTENLEGNVHRILLGNVQTIPIQIIDNHPALSKLKSIYDFIFLTLMDYHYCCTTEKNLSFLFSGFVTYK